MIIENPEDRAKLEICKYWNITEEEIEPKDVLTVWFCYILGGWKTLMFINSYPYNYFEVTYDFNKGYIYLDHYKKVKNVPIPVNDEIKPTGTIESALALAELREKLTRDIPKEA